MQISEDENAVATSDLRRRHIALNRRICRRVCADEIKDAAGSKRIFQSERLNDSDAHDAKQDDGFETHFFSCTFLFSFIVSILYVLRFKKNLTFLLPDGGVFFVAARLLFYCFSAFESLGQKKKKRGKKTIIFKSGQEKGDLSNEEINLNSSFNRIRLGAKSEATKKTHLFKSVCNVLISHIPPKCHSNKFGFNEEFNKRSNLIEGTKNNHSVLV